MAFTMYASGISPVSRSEDDAMNGFDFDSIQYFNPSFLEKSAFPIIYHFGLIGEGMLAQQTVKKIRVRGSRVCSAELYLT